MRYVPPALLANGVYRTGCVASAGGWGYKRSCLPQYGVWVHRCVSDRSLLSRVKRTSAFEAVMCR
jgi:hypothetical protein